jgi:hypothetical protein
MYLGSICLAKHDLGLIKCEFIGTIGNSIVVAIGSCLIIVSCLCCFCSGKFKNHLKPKVIAIYSEDLEYSRYEAEIYGDIVLSYQQLFSEKLRKDRYDEESDPRIDFSLLSGPILLWLCCHDDQAKLIIRSLSETQSKYYVLAIFLNCCYSKKTKSDIQSPFPVVMFEDINVPVDDLDSMLQSIRLLDVIESFDRSSYLTDVVEKFNQALKKVILTYLKSKENNLEIEKRGGKRGGVKYRSPPMNNNDYEEEENNIDNNDKKHDLLSFLNSSHLHSPKINKNNSKNKGNHKVILLKAGFMSNINEIGIGTGFDQPIKIKFIELTQNEVFLSYPYDEIGTLAFNYDNGNVIIEFEDHLVKVIDWVKAGIYVIKNDELYYKTENGLKSYDEVHKD